LTETVGLHPFAGGMPYPWERPEAMALYDALSDAVRTTNEIDMLVRAAAPGAPPLNLGQPPGAIWRDALAEIALAGGLLDLCRRLAGDGRVAVAQAAQAMVDAKSAVRRRLGGGGQLVVDREELRGYVEELTLEESLVKVLLVRGEPRSGKSWSRLLFERAARDRGAEVVYLRRGMAPTVGLAVRKLFAILGVPEPVAEANTTDGAWFQEVCNQLLLAARAQERRLWIAVDDLGHGPDGASLMDDDIRAFFQQLALNLEDPATHRWFRLLLINYPDGEVPTGWDADRGLTLLDDHLEARAAAVIARADAPVPAGDPREVHPRVRRIHDEVKGELAALGKGPG
jgi:hypothetical protein